MEVLDFIEKNFSQVLFLTWEHIFMVGLSLIIGTAIGVPLGILITKKESWAKNVINTANIIMTIPSIALFGLMMPILGIVGHGLGKVPAIVALVLYSQLPIIRNTYVAIKDIPPFIKDAAKGMGMNRWQLLKEVEIPLAIPIIIAGLRTAAVMNIGIGAIAAYIGAGGLGVYIQQGIDRVYPEMIIAGAVLISLFAILVDGLMALVEYVFTPIIGIVLTRPKFRRYSGIAMYIVGLGQTIPSLAVLALVMSFLGIGTKPAIFALTIYSVLPIARNTLAGIRSVPESVLDAARGIGMTPTEILFNVELPIAMKVILTGFRISLVMNIGTATFAYLIGAGGMGDWIFSGINMMRIDKLLAGAIPVTLMALFADFLVDLLGVLLIPKGLRWKEE